MIIGIEQVQANLEKVKESISPEQIESVLLLGAQVIAEDARNRAPLGNKKYYQSKRTRRYGGGNLKRGIEAKVIHREGSTVAAIAAVNYKIAPHAHLVEFGHLLVRGKKGHIVGFVPPHPFFRPAWEARSEQVSQGVVEELKNLVEGSVNG